MEFDDIFELLEAVRLYRLVGKETLINFNSTTGSVLGYTTADSEARANTWTIATRRAKESARNRGTKEGERIRELLSSYVGRRQLLEELRSGTLEYGIARPPKVVETEQLTPKQCTIPGL